MKVNVSITLDIDQAAWVANYGNDGDVRKDVKEHVANLVRAHLDDLGLLAGSAPQHDDSRCDY